MVRFGQKSAKFFTILGAVAVLGLGVRAYPVSAAWAADGSSEKQAEEYGTSEGEVMIIRFNRETVYFKNPLRKMVARVAEVKPNATYEVQSIIPSANVQKRVEGRGYDVNVQNVINIFAKYGVSADRIKVTTVNSDSADYQQIKIFVK